MRTPPPCANRLATVPLTAACALTLLAAAPWVQYVGGYERRLSDRLARMDGQATYAEVCERMKEGGKFRYDGTDHLEPQRPEVTEARKAGDCKDLALWLASKLNDPSLMFVEGRFDNGAGRHAWLEWFGDGELWILDLTAHFNGSVPMRASESHSPTSAWYYAPDRLITRYGTFTARGSISDAR